MEDVRSLYEVCTLKTNVWSNSSDCMYIRLVTNMIEHAFEMELYIILSNLENFAGIGPFKSQNFIVPANTGSVFSCK